MAVISKVTAAGNSNMPISHTLYGTCSTAAATQEKAVTCADFDLATPITGMTIVVKFTNSNTYNGTVKLNINSKGAKNAYRYGTTNIGTNVQTSWPAGAAVAFTFDGTNWILTQPNYDTNSTGYLPTSGGTVTGNITAKFSGIDASLADNGVTSTQYPTTFNIVDKNDRILTRKEGVISSDGNIAAYWYIRNYDTSGTQVAQKGIRMTMNKSGNLTYSVDDAANFRSAISAAAASHTHNYAGSSSAGGDATRALAVKDNGNSNTITVQYSGSGINSASWFCAWDGYNIRAISAANTLSAIGAASSSHTHSYLPLSGGTMSGGISMVGNRIYWKENNYGDQFAIVPNFSGTDDTNLLKIQSAVGAQGTTPDMTDKVTISGKTGNVNITTGGLSVKGSITQNGTAVSLAGHTHSYLPLSGGTLTGALSGTSTTMSGAITSGGNITFGNGTTATLIAKTPSRTDGILWAGGSKKTAGDANGTVVRLQGGGLMMVGGGEYPTNRYNLADLNDGDETLFLGSDGAVYVETNGQTIANRKTFTFGADGTFNSPSTIKQNGTAVSLSGHTHSYLPLSGGTMTGNFARKDSTHDLKQSNNGVSSTQWPGYSLKDKNDYTYSGFYSSVGNDGKTGTGMWVYNRNSEGSQVSQGSIAIYADKSGNISYSVSNPSGFRSAISAAAASHTHSVSTISIGSASAGTAIAADDITAWTTNTPTAVTSKTVVTSASGGTAAISKGVFTFTNTSFSTGASCTVTAGTAASLSYTARSIPNISVTSKTVATGVTSS